MLDKKTIINLANLARLQLSAEEVALYQHQLQEVLGYVEKIKTLPLEQVAPSLSGVQGKNSVTRADKVSSSDPTLIQQAIHNQDNYVVAAAVFTNAARKNK